jgi:predicted PhzF superfamily epimerase YddE/YHI9
MRTPIFQVDAFTTRRFAGNPAAVMPLVAFLEDAVLQAIAAENNLSETAFLVPEGDEYRVRWFTPTTEVPLCGHATLASAAVVMERLEPGRCSVVFLSVSGPLTVRRTEAGYVPVEVWADAFNYMAVLESAQRVRALAPDLAAIGRLERSGVIVTAAGDEPYDFVSRYFAPAKGIPEDPVTGGAHCALVPYWARRLGKRELRAFQASWRGGEIVCRLAHDRVELAGSCVFYLEGEATI